MIAYQPLVGFNCVIHNRAQRPPPPQRRHSTSERTFSESNMRELTAGLGPCLVDGAKIAIQEDAAFLRAPQNMPCRVIGIRFRVLPDGVLSVIAKVMGNALHISAAYRHDREAAAVRACCTVHITLNLCCQYVKWLRPIVVRREIAAEMCVFRFLQFCLPPDLDQVREHPSSILPWRRERKAPKSAATFFLQLH
jgi:hypothetical protein